MSLGDMPPELCLKIMGHMEQQGQLKSLSSLSQTCRSLYQMGTPILYSTSLTHDSKICTALLCAVTRNCAGTLTKLIKYGMPVNGLFHENECQDNHFITPLAMAANQGRTELVRKILRVPGVDVNKTDAHQETALHYAVMSASVETAILLLYQRGILADVRSDTGRTPLSLAVGCGDTLMVRLLLAQGSSVDPDSRCSRGRSPLFIAVDQQLFDSEIVELLIDTGRVDVNFIDPVSRFTPLIVAVLKNLPDVVQFLVLHPDIDPNLAAHGNSVVPIAVAAAQGHTEIVRILLSHPDTDPDRALFPLSRALLLAHRRGREQIVNMLLADARVEQGSRDLLKGQRLFFEARHACQVM